MARRLVCTEDGASKFWEASVEGTSLTVRFGKLGTAGQLKVKTFAAAADAEKELQKLVKEKLGKGYRDEEGGAPAPAPSPPAVAAAPPVTEAPAPRGDKPIKPAAKAPGRKATAKVLRYGYIGRKGEWALTPRFDQAGAFGDGLAPARQGELWGYVDHAGAFVVPPTFAKAGQFSKGVAHVTRGYREEDIDVRGATLPTPDRPRVDLPYSEGLAVCTVEQGGQKRAGYLDPSRRWVIEPRFEAATPFQEGLAWVRLPGRETFTLLDRSGAVVAETPFRGGVARFVDGLARVQTADGWGYADPTGRLAIDLGPMKTVQIVTKLTESSTVSQRHWGWNHPGTDFSGGHAAVTSDGKTFSILDRQGTKVGEIACTSVGAFSDGLARFTAGEGMAARFGYVGVDGKVVIPPTLELAGDFRGGLAWVQRGFRDGALLDRDGRVVVGGVAWHADFDEHGMALASVGQVPGLRGAKCGAVDRTGAWVIEPALFKIEPFVGDRAVARAPDEQGEGGKWGVIDRRGAFVVPAKYDRIGTLDVLTLVNVGGKEKDGNLVGGKWGYLDASGAEVIPPRFDAHGGRFIEDVAAVGVLEEKAVSDEEAARFPFLFYGRDPAEWAEGANMGHGYKLRFAAEPDAATRGAVEAAFAKAASKTQVEVGPKSWTWDGAWALLYVGEQEPPTPRRDGEEGTDYSELFSEVARALQAAHAAAPLAEAISLNARAYSDDAWEAWTRKMQPRPSKSPAFGGQRGFLFEE